MPTLNWIGKEWLHQPLSGFHHQDEERQNHSP